jgi:hypothetical protein
MKTGLRRAGLAMRPSIKQIRKRVCKYIWREFPAKAILPRPAPRRKMRGQAIK